MKTKRRPIIATSLRDQNSSFAAVNSGQDEGKLEKGVLAVNGGSVIINRIPMTSDPGVNIPGILNMSISPTGPISSFSYRIDVVGACPAGKFDSKLEFTDETGDTYVLRIYSETAHTHSLYYNSNRPNIVKITWDI